MYTLQLLIPALPKSLNVALRTNRWASNKTNRGWDTLVYQLVRDKLPETPLQRARIEITRFSDRMLDYDGLVGSMKPVVDALVTCGVLIDDRWSVTGPWVVDQKFRAKKEGPLLIVTIAELPS